MMEDAESENVGEEECILSLAENVKKHLHIVFCVNYGSPLYK